MRTGEVHQMGFCSQQVPQQSRIGHKSVQGGDYLKYALFEAILSCVVDLHSLIEHHLQVRQQSAQLSFQFPQFEQSLGVVWVLMCMEMRMGVEECGETFA